MKFSTAFRRPASIFAFGFTTLIAMTLPSCTTVTSPEHRIANDPERFDAVPEKFRDQVRQGQVAEGMSKDAVYIAWGRPHETQESSRNGRSLQAWVYYGAESIPVQTVGIGYRHRHGYGYYGGCHEPFYDFGFDYAQREYIAAKVEFENGKVIYWERNERR